MAPTQEDLKLKMELEVSVKSPPPSSLSVFFVSIIIFISFDYSFFFFVHNTLIHCLAANGTGACARTSLRVRFALLRRRGPREFRSGHSSPPVGRSGRRRAAVARRRRCFCRGAQPGAEACGGQAADGPSAAGAAGEVSRRGTGFFFFFFYCLRTCTFVRVQVPRLTPSSHSQWKWKMRPSHLRHRRSRRTPR